ncbi:ankyrin repeat domain-containing protein [Caldichromatium japonicum]|uniref:Ankyrin repeat domain-containing protein n=1 Tax=Caldichromatium japonicum TaxID=2699430 RepID=A0A6G7VBY3_9GAMM|nr:ankyrin repeat domain-containing protein [Caldichromatium japonicum]QIK37569.1 ankyrin repeat domain-containing protein [Caldichromatium japonicum]
MNRFHPSLTLLLLLALLAACGPADQGEGVADGNSPLIEAAEQGDLAAVEQLLARHVNPDPRTECGWTPLMKAALNGHVAIVERLLQAGARVDAEDIGGYTALMVAAQNNHAAIVELLLKRGAQINRQERTKGWTAMIWAAKQGHTSTVKILLQYGADPRIRDLEGKSAADWAQAESHPEVLALLR